MAQTIFIRMTASGSSHSGTTTTYAASVASGTVSPNTGIAASSLVDGLWFTASSDSVSSITCTVESGSGEVCTNETANATWVPVSPSPSASPPNSSPAAPDPSATPSVTPSSSPPNSSPVPDVTPSNTPSNSVVWYSFLASEVQDDTGTACNVSNTAKTYYNTTASYAVGSMNVYNSTNLADPVTGSGWIGTGSFAKAIGGGVLASATSSCAGLGLSLQTFYRSAPKQSSSFSEFCDTPGYTINDPTYAYLPSSFGLTHIVNATIYDSTGSDASDPTGFTRVADTLVSGVRYYYAINAVSSNMTGSGASGFNTSGSINWNTIQLRHGASETSVPSTSWTIDCGSGGGSGPIP